MAEPAPEDREVAHFVVKPKIFDRIVGFLEGQRIRDALGLYDAVLKTSTPVYVDQLPEPKKAEILKLPGERKGDGRIVDPEKIPDDEADSENRDGEVEIDNETKESAE